MNYNLVKARKTDLDRLINYKLATTINKTMSEQEKAKISAFVKSRVPNQISSYQLIKINEKVVGCLRLVDYEDGVLIDEIFVENEFRNKGIGSSIIKDILKDNNVVYLWVYKTNKIAKQMYQKLGFKTILTEDYREFMQYKKFNKKSKM